MPKADELGMATPLPRRRHWPLPTLLLFCTGICPAITGDPADFTYRSNTTEVRVNFSALDQNNHGVATLQSGDFAVVDKDIIVRNFRSFSRSDWTNLEIGVLIDGSESVQPRFRQEIADVLELISQTAGVPDENLSLFVFHGSQPALLCARDCRATHAAERLPEDQTGGFTPLFDTIVFATDFLAQHSEAHAEKVLIVFSDGADTISRQSLDDAIDAALTDDVQLECIDLSSSASFVQGGGILRKLAGASGGRYFPAAHSMDAAVNGILEGFRASYTVTYQMPSHAAGFHTLRILPTHNVNLQFRGRSGYYYPEQIR